MTDIVLVSLLLVGVVALVIAGAYVLLKLFNGEVLP